MDDSWDDAALAALDAAEERAIAAAAAAVPTSEKNIASHPAPVSEKKEEHDCDKWDAAASGSNAIEVSMPPEKRPMENDTDEWDDPAMLAALDAAEAAMSPQQPKKQRKLETTRQGARSTSCWGYARFADGTAKFFDSPADTIAPDTGVLQSTTKLESNSLYPV